MALWANWLSRHSFKVEITGSSPVGATQAGVYFTGAQAGITQLVEYLFSNQNVGGSNPSTGSKLASLTLW